MCTCDHVVSMSAQLDAIVALVEGLRDGQIADPRPERLRAITRNLPTCEPYNRFFFAWVQKTKPQRIVETGTDRGRSAIHLALGHPGAKVTSIDIDGGCTRLLEAFQIPNVQALTGSSTDPKIVARFENRSIDILFIDSLHECDHVRSEIAVYMPKLRHGALVFMDDIHLSPGMERVWNEIDLPKREISDLHFTGFGVFEVV